MFKLKFEGRKRRNNVESSSGIGESECEGPVVGKNSEQSGNRKWPLWLKSVMGGGDWHRMRWIVARSHKFRLFEKWRGKSHKAWKPVRKQPPSNVYTLGMQ